MPLCISLFLTRTDPDVLRNHQAYCGRHGYPHRVHAPVLGSAAQQQVYKYQLLRRELAGLADGDWLLFLDQDSVVTHPVGAEQLVEGVDAVIVEYPPGEGLAGPVAMTNMLLLRNTPANRQVLAAAATEVSHAMVVQAREGIDEYAVLRAVGVLPCNAMRAGSYANVNWRIYDWYKAPVFVIHLGHLPTAQVGQRVLHDARLQNALVRWINARTEQGRPLLAPVSPPPSQVPYEAFQPERPVALVTLYTHHITAYASIAEANVRRYCERHGLAYHVYRAIPPELDPGINGTWVKTWLLLRHFHAHEWVIWIDADILFGNQQRPLQDLLSGRDVLLAKDIGDWPVNAGVLGFRRTPDNERVLRRIWERIEAVPDKSTTYSSMGDQFYVNEVLGQEGLLGEATVHDCLSVNTPSQLADDDTLMVHFIGLGEPYRSVYMADMDARSLARG